MDQFDGTLTGTTTLLDSGLESNDTNKEVILYCPDL